MEQLGAKSFFRQTETSLFPSLLDTTRAKRGQFPVCKLEPLPSLLPLSTSTPTPTPMVNTDVPKPPLESLQHQRLRKPGNE
ncbi:hypothetical protein V6N12_064468 [Hibiscus sabdariffa]|uniref:Uncharacterized protein n=1 Tax=Hibiscus sabdariffa TaxID=183260 RepID=A0ABR2G6M2_9ROSI